MKAKTKNIIGSIIMIILILTVISLLILAVGWKVVLVLISVVLIWFLFCFASDLINADDNDNDGYTW